MFHHPKYMTELLCIFIPSLSSFHRCNYKTAQTYWTSEGLWWEPWFISTSLLTVMSWSLTWKSKTNLHNEDTKICSTASSSLRMWLDVGEKNFVARCLQKKHDLWKMPKSLNVRWHFSCTVKEKSSCHEGGQNTQNWNKKPHHDQVRCSRVEKDVTPSSCTNKRNIRVQCCLWNVTEE